MLLMILLPQKKHFKESCIKMKKQSTKQKTMRLKLAKKKSKRKQISEYHINKFDMTDEERNYIISTQVSMQIRYNDPNCVWSVEQIKEKLEYYKLQKQMNMSYLKSVNGFSIFVANQTSESA